MGMELQLGKRKTFWVGGWQYVHITVNVLNATDLYI